MSDAIKTGQTLGLDSPATDSADLPYTLPLELTVNDPATIAALCAYPEGEAREQFALNALRIGVLALKQASGQIDAELVRRESERLLDALHGQLSEHSRSVHDRMTGSLKEYFNPQDGRFHERVKRLVEKDGELETLLQRQIGSEDSELCRTLASHFGEESPLMKVLSPDQSKGLLKTLQETLDEKLKEQRKHVLDQFSLDNKAGALSRFIAELSDHQGELTKKLNTKIDEVVKEFSLDDENSALSRLVNNVDRAQKKITSEFSLDEENSSLFRLKRELLGLLKEDRETNQKFQEEVKLTLHAMVARKKEADRSTQHGLDFEHALFEYVQHHGQRLGDVVTHTGNSTGRIKNCKKGDCVIELGPESAAPGARVVLEAKEDSSYQLTHALDYIDEARKNRDAAVGLFVFSQRTAPEGIEPLARYGNDVCVVWEPEDAASDVFLQAGMTLARALCIRSSGSEESKTDFQAIDKAILEIEKRSGTLGEVETWASTIKSSSEKILKRIAGARKSLEKQVALLQEKTAAVKNALSADQDV